VSELFLKIVNMSISAGWLVLAVLALRLLLRKAPRWVYVLLWGLVAVRLVCPVSIESALSLIPQPVGSGELVAGWADDYVGDISIHHENSIYYDAAVTAGREPIYDGEGGYYVVTKYDQLGEPATVENTVVPVLAAVWVVGCCAMLAYALISYLRLCRQIGTAVRLRENLFQSEAVASPFVLGILRPKIYLPFGMGERDMSHVLAHEDAHIRRRDHWWKPLGFLLLAVHWFNPLLWLAYLLLCRDIELACDERVVRSLGDEQRAVYSQALLACTVPHRLIAACPLAFGEVGVKERVKSVLSYKKPAFWIVVIAVAACAVTAVCFLTNPPGSSGEPDLSFLNYENAISLVADREEIQAIYCPPSDGSSDSLIQIGVASGSELAKYLDQWDWRECPAPRQRLSSPGSVEFIIEDDHRITVYQRKALSLRQYAVVQYGEEERYYSIDRNDYPDALALVAAPPRPSDSEEPAVMEWFNYLDSPSEMPWDGRLEIDVPQFPDVTFRWYSEKVEAVTENGIVPLYYGMPIWNAYFRDLTGDGLPELCSTVSYGSGMIDTHVIVYDYANGVQYELENRGEYDYALSMQDGELVVTKSDYLSREALETGVLSCEGGVLQMAGVKPVSEDDSSAAQPSVSEKPLQEGTLPPQNLDKETAEQFISEALSTLTVHEDNTATFTLPSVIPSDPEGKTQLSVSMNATYVIEAGSYDVESFLDSETDWQGGETFTADFSRGEGRLHEVMLRVAFMTEIDEHTAKQYAGDYVKLTSPFVYGQSAGDAITGPLFRFVTLEDRLLTASYATPEGRRFDIQMTLPEGIRVRGDRAGDSLSPYPVILLMRDGQEIGSLVPMEYGATDEETLAAIEQSATNFPMQIYAPIALSSMVYWEQEGLESYYLPGGNISTVCHPTADDHVISDCVLAYNLQSEPYFLYLSLTPGALTAAELSDLAQSVAFT